MLTLVMLAASSWSVTIHHVEKLTVKTRGQVASDDTAFDTKAKLTGTPTSFTVEGRDLPRASVREEDGAPVITFDGTPKPSVAQVLRRTLGRLVVQDPEREAMSTCSAQTQAATQRWLVTGVARINGSEPSEVTLSELTVKCTPTKPGTKLDVSFRASVPRATLTVVLQPKGTLTVDRSVWATQWRLEGPVHATSEGSDVEITGTFSSSLSLAPNGR
jgi:hypothetical protein